MIVNLPSGTSSARYKASRVPSLLPNRAALAPALTQIVVGVGLVQTYGNLGDWRPGVGRI
jgi:hypothetical protein